MRKRCVVNLATNNHWYPKGQKRLGDSLKEHDFQGTYKSFLGEGELGCPSHKENPYSFKTYALWNAIEEGFDTAMWLDCSVWAIKPVEPIFEEIEKKGYYFESSGWNCGQFSTNECLEALGITRDMAFDIPMLSAGVSGFDLKDSTTLEVLKVWHEYSIGGITFPGPYTNDRNQISSDNRVLGHRHDQSVLSILAHQFGLEVDNPKFFQYKRKGIQIWEETICLLQGM